MSAGEKNFPAFSFTSTAKYSWNTSTAYSSWCRYRCSDRTPGRWTCPGTWRRRTSSADRYSDTRNCSDPCSWPVLHCSAHRRSSPSVREHTAQEEPLGISVGRVDQHLFRRHQIASVQRLANCIVVTRRGRRGWAIALSSPISAAGRRTILHQGIVSLVDFLQFFLRQVRKRIVLILIRMILLDQLLICRFLSPPQKLRALNLIPHMDYSCMIVLSLRTASVRRRIPIKIMLSMIPLFFFYVEKVICFCHFRKIII